MNATAERISASVARTVWRVTLEDGRTYFATTYPDSDRLYVETGIRRRAVSKTVGVKLHETIRQAIAAAQSPPVATRR